MQSPLSSWTRYATGLFEIRRAMMPLRRSPARRRSHAGWPGRLAAEVQVLEERALLSAAIAMNDVSVVEGDATIKPVDAFVAAGVSNPRNVAFSPSGSDFYVASQNTDQVLRYDGHDGHFIGIAMSSSDGLVGPWALAFGPDGKLYASGKTSQNIMSYDPASGQVATFVAAGSGINIAKGMTFGPDGNLYVSTTGNIGDSIPDQILRFWGPGSQSPGAADPSAGNRGAVFVNDASPNGSDPNAWDNPNGLAFGPDGRLYVAETHDQSINRYDANGNFSGVFVTAGSGGLNGPTTLTFRPDGDLYVTSQNNNQVLRYNAATGAFVDAVIPATSGGLVNPNGLAFDAAGNLYVASTNSGQVLRFGVGSLAAFTVTLDAPSSLPVTVKYATADGSALAGIDYAARTGTLTFAPGETARTILVPTLSDGVSAGDKSFVVNLSAPTGGATLADSQGVGTIRDGETKFHVVDDGAADRTYNYGSTGAAVGNSTLNSGDTDPRGAASNAAGTMTWVVDSNKKVYVYNEAGSVLGSWTPGSLKSGAVVEGLATNGTDIWLLDSKNATMYRYSGAASRLSGTQNAISSFTLNNADANGMGIVTDGTSLWVVNDAGSGSDKVFKYSLSGTLLGSWTIDAANAHPTGITIDPNHVSNIWIVDDVALKVFQYNSAATRTSGSQNAATTFTLAAGDTNPQDIADPPPVAAILTPAPTSPVPPQTATPPFNGILLPGLGTNPDTAEGDGDWVQTGVSVIPNWKGKRTSAGFRSSSR